MQPTAALATVWAMATCAMCAEAIPDGAGRCPHCGEVQDRPTTPRPAGGSGYDLMQDKIGLVPNVRVKDNGIQAVVTVAATALGVGLGALLGGKEGALAGALLGLVLGGLGSGFVLMVIGLTRR